jgi:tetratricopeptide (TPR) repeat protein
MENGSTARSAPTIRRRWFVLGLLGIGLAVLAAWVLRVQATARSNLERGRASLEADDPAAARQFLEQCLAVWPTSAEANFRAAQAARRCGDFPQAQRFLEEAGQLGWDPAAIGLEKSLLRAQTGFWREEEHTLLRAIADANAETPRVLEVAVPAYMGEFRWYEAQALAERWTQLRPESATAWGLLGEILERRRKKQEAVNALREAVRLNPDNVPNRLRLARLLVETRQPPAEAAEHLTWLREADPANSSVPVLLAVCREAQGHADEAAGALDQVIAQNPKDAKAYYHRGRLELNRDRASAALPFLRKAAELEPSDPEILYSVLLSVQRVGTPAEIREAEERWRRCDADLKRVTDLARAVAASPNDPDLRREMGEIYLRNHQEKEGVRWLESALRERPDHVPTHRLLADYYERTGQPERAAHHRSMIQLTEESRK